jgi:hypothetical protein
VECLVYIVILRLTLKVVGFGRAWRAVNRLMPAAAPDEVPRDLTTTIRHLGAAAAFFPGRARCLEQALTLYVVLRRRRLPVVLRLGVKPLGFVAHAWVEYHGVAIAERGEILRAIVPLPLLPT